MKSPSVALPILIICYFGVTSARNVYLSKSKVDNWLSLPINDNIKCKSKVKEILYQEANAQYQVYLRKFIEPIELQGIAESNFVMHNIYNSGMINMLKNLIKIIQDCLDDNNRLDSEGIVEVIDQVTKAHAMKIIRVEPITQEDINCLDKMSSNANSSCEELLNCANNKGHEMTISNLLILEGLQNSYCKKTLAFAICVMTNIRDCRPQIKKVISVLMSPIEIDVGENLNQERNADMIESITTVEPLYCDTQTGMESSEWD